jgi:hypothetical protein
LLPNDKIKSNKIKKQKVFFVVIVKSTNAKHKAHGASDSSAAVRSQLAVMTHWMMSHPNS